MSINRRQHLLALASFFGLFAFVGDGRSAPPNKITIALIAKMSGLLASTAGAISLFGESIVHLKQLGTKEIDASAARKVHADLLNLRAHLEDLVSGQNMPLLRSINDYVEKQSEIPKPSAEVSGLLWLAVVRKVEGAAERVNALLQEVRKIRSDFVAEDAYSGIESALHGVTILESLKEMPPPTEEHELQELAKAGAEYQKLTQATKLASAQLAAYIKSTNK
jgi:hypothetical protein